MDTSIYVDGHKKMAFNTFNIENLDKQFLFVFPTTVNQGSPAEVNILWRLNVYKLQVVNKQKKFEIRACVLLV